MNKHANSYFKLLSVAMLFILFSSKAQAQESLPGHAIQITGGYSEHGSGDMTGIGVGAEYVRYVHEKLFLNYNLRTTIHNSKQEIIINNTVTGTTQDASIRFTTGGVQLGVDGGFSFVRNKTIVAGVAIGAFVRYQSASNGADGYSLYGPALTGLPLILVEYANKTPQQTVSFGGVLQLNLDVNISQRMYVGLIPRIQTDTNGDGVLFLGLSVGRRF